MNISYNRQFSRFFFKFVWVVYGGDLTGFCRSLLKIIQKVDQWQTKLKISQNVHGYSRYEPLWYAHSTALPQSYTASIGSGRCVLKFKALIRPYGLAGCHQWVTGRSQNVLIHLHLVNARITYKNMDIFYIDPLSDLRPDLEASGCRDFEYVTKYIVLQNSKY